MYCDKNMTICPNCGSETEDDSVFCEECGYQLQNKPVKPTKQELPEQQSKPKKIKFVKHKK